MGKVIKYFLAYAAILILSTFGVQTVSAITEEKQMLTAENLIAASSIGNIIAIAVFTLAKWTPFSLEFVRSKPWPIIYWCVLISLGMLIPSAEIEGLIPDNLRTDSVADEMKMIMSNWWGYIDIGILAPIAEELVFRGGIQKAAVKYFDTRLKGNTAHWGAIAFSATLFAAFHGNLAQIPHAFLVGLLMGWLCYRSGSILPGIIVHLINNTIAFTMYKLYPKSYDMELIDFFGGSELRLGMAVLLSLMLFAPALYQLHKLLKNKA